MMVMTDHETRPETSEPQSDQPQPVSTEEGGYRSPGSIKLGPLVISAKFSIILIFIIVIGFNLLLFLGVILAALYRAGRL